MNDDYSLQATQVQVFGFDVVPEISMAADLVALLALVIAIVTFLANQIITHRIARRQHTLTLLAIINEEGPVSRAQMQMARWIRYGRSFADDDVSDEDDQTIIPLLDYYDFVCHNVLRGDLDTDTVKVHIGGRMRATYQLLQHYIAARRAKLSHRDQLYRPLERVVNEIIGDQPL